MLGESCLGPAGSGHVRERLQGWGEGGPDRTSASGALPPVQRAGEGWALGRSRGDGPLTLTAASRHSASCVSAGDTAGAQSTAVAAARCKASVFPKGAQASVLG